MYHLLCTDNDKDIKVYSITGKSIGAVWREPYRRETDRGWEALEDRGCMQTKSGSLRYWHDEHAISKACP